MAVVFVSYQIDVVAISCVFDGIDCLLKNQFAILPMFRLFEVGRPGVVVDAVGDWFSVMVVIVIVVVVVRGG
jgi:hypothetical protein